MRYIGEINVALEGATLEVLHDVGPMLKQALREEIAAEDNPCVEDFDVTVDERLVELVVSLTMNGIREKYLDDFADDLITGAIKRLHSGSAGYALMESALTPA